MGCQIRGRSLLLNIFESSSVDNLLSTSLHHHISSQPNRKVERSVKTFEKAQVKLGGGGTVYFSNVYRTKTHDALPNRKLRKQVLMDCILKTNQQVMLPKGLWVTLRTPTLVRDYKLRYGAWTEELVTGSKSQVIYDLAVEKDKCLHINQLQRSVAP